MKVNQPWNVGREIRVPGEEWGVKLEAVFKNESVRVYKVFMESIHL